MAYAGMLNIYYDPTGSAGILGREFSFALGQQLPVAFIGSPEQDKAQTKAFADFRRSCPSVQADAPTLNLGYWPNSRRLPGKPVIAYIAWETSRIPRPYKKKMRKLERIWVPSHWQKNIFIRNGLDAHRIDVVPEGFDPRLFYPPEYNRSTKRPFRFLFVGKWEVRKGIRQLLQAFAREFDPAEPVELLLSANNPFRPELDTDEVLHDTLLKLGAADRRIHNLPTMNRTELAQLYREVDAFVLPTRSEGWGLPLLEAMASGLPCIVTEYSGLTEYTSHDSVYYLRHGPCLVPAWDPVFFKPSWYWGRWARPNVKHLRQLMRTVYENPEAARRVGDIAANNAHENWTWDHAASKALACLSQSVTELK
jgi:glycosyltransferase involved in cell wall biosynthesis